MFFVIILDVTRDDFVLQGRRSCKPDLATSKEDN